MTDVTSGVDVSLLPKKYGNIYHSGRDREVALFVRNLEPEEGDTREWLYCTRGPYDQAVGVAVRGFSPVKFGTVSHPPHDCRFVIDSSYRVIVDGEYDIIMDAPDLSWGGEKLTADEFLQWVNPNNRPAGEVFARTTEPYDWLDEHYEKFGDEPPKVT